MNEKESLDFVEKIVQECEKKGIWVDVTQERKPVLKKINVTFSVKIEERKKSGLRSLKSEEYKRSSFDTY